MYCTRLRDPLLQHGWVVQERVLAPRMLNFAPGQIYWECRRLQSSEYHPEHIAPSTRVGSAKNIHRSILALKDVSEAMTLWTDVVQHYTNCQFTMEMDKLVAISGIANAILDHFKDLRYFGGLWSHDLVRWLSWEPMKGYPTKSPKVYRAPSWSWASLDGNIVPLFTTNTYSQVLNASVLEVVPVPVRASTGPLTGGFIRMKGHLFTFSLGIYTLGGRQYRLNGQKSTSKLLDVRPDVISDVQAGTSTRLHILPFDH